MEKRTFTIKIIAGMLLFVGTTLTMKAQTTKKLVTMYGEKVDYAPHLKADLDSPTFSGTPKVPTPTPTADVLEIVNVQYVIDAVSAATGGTVIVDGTEAAKGIVELADDAETLAGTSRALAVHPAGLKVELDKKATVASVALKADQTAVDASLLLKADVSALAAKANIDSPAFLGTPTAPTAALGDSTVQLATNEFVANAIAAIPAVTISDASETVEGIVELADDAETLAGTSRALAVHPAGLKVELDKKATVASVALKADQTAVDASLLLKADVSALAAKADLVSPVFEGTPTAPVPANTAQGSLELANVDFVLDAIAAIPAVTISDASETVEGIVEYADNTEINETLRIDRAVHPAGLHAVVDAKVAPKANIASPTFTGTPAADTAPAGTNTTQLATTAFVKAAVDTSATTTALKTVEFATPIVGQASFPLGSAPTSIDTVRFYINGTRIVKEALSLTGSNVGYDSTKNGGFALSTTDVVVIDYN